MNDEQLHQLRITYIDAAIGEINAVCNVLAATDTTNGKERGLIAEQHGLAAQAAFQAYQAGCIELAGFDILSQLSGEVQNETLPGLEN